MSAAAVRESLSRERASTDARSLGAFDRQRAIRKMFEDGATGRRLRLIVTDELGILRRAEAAGRSALWSKETFTMNARWGQATRARGFVKGCCSAGQSGDGGVVTTSDDAPSGWLAVARNDKTAEVIEMATGAAMGGGPVDVGGTPVAVDLFGPGSAREGCRLVTVTEEGDAVVHACGYEGVVTGFGDLSLGVGAGQERIVEEWSEESRFKVIGNALSARVGGGGDRLICGGKGQGNDVKMYDVEEQKVLYKSKPPPPNWLGYRAPPYVSAMHFIPGTDCREFLVGTGEHMLRRYDVREKRAVMDVPIGEWVITSLQMNHDQSVAYVANNHGNLFGFDMKTQRMAHKFKGHQGGIRQIAVHPEEDLIVSAGLDRWLRVFSMSTRKCLGQVYMQQVMSGVQWDVRSPAWEEAFAEAEKKAKGKKKKKKARAVEDADDEEVPKKKKKLKKSDGEKVAKKKKKKVRRDDDDDEF